MAYTDVAFPAKFTNEGMKAIFPHDLSLKTTPMIYNDDLATPFFENQADFIATLQTIKFKLGKAEAQSFAMGAKNSGEIYNAIMAAAANNKLTISYNEIMAIAVFAATTKQAYAIWFHQLDQTLLPQPQSSFEVQISRDKKYVLQANYVEKDKQMGEYRGSTKIRGELTTLVKVKGAGAVTATSVSTYTVEPRLESFEVETTVWMNRLLPSAFTYLRRLSATDDFNEKDLFLLTPFLSDPKFRESFGLKLKSAKDATASRELVADFVKLCFEGTKRELDIILKSLELPRTALEAASVTSTSMSRTASTSHLPVEISQSLSTASTSSAVPRREGERQLSSAVPLQISHGGPSAPSPSATSLLQPSTNTYPFDQPQTAEQLRTQQQAQEQQLQFQQQHRAMRPPQPPLLSPAQKYAREFEMLVNLESKVSYETTLDKHIKSIVEAIKNLTANEVTENQAMLTEVMASSRKAVLDPHDQPNLNNLNALIKPLQRKNLARLAAAVSLLVIGVGLAVVATAVAVASFGGTHLLSAWGIAVAHNTLTKALALAGSVVGSGLTVGGLALFSSHPLKKILSSADAIALQASKEQQLHPRPARSV